LHLFLIIVYCQFYNTASVKIKWKESILDDSKIKRYFEKIFYLNDNVYRVYEINRYNFGK